MVRHSVGHAQISDSRTMKGEAMDGATFWILAMLAAFSVGLAKGGAPAFGVLAVPILSLVVSPVTAAGLVLPVLVFSDVFGVWAYRKDVNWGVLKIAVLGILLGTALGWATAHIVSEQFVRVLVGSIGLVFALNLLRTSGKAPPPAQTATLGAGVFWTTIAGFTSFVSHAGAPPWQVWLMPQRLPKMAFAGTTTVGFAIMNVAKIFPYYQLGQLEVESLKVSMVMFAPALFAVFVGYRLVRILPERLFYAIVTWMLLAVSLKLIWDGVLG